MRTWLNGRLAEPLRSQISLAMKSRGPQLCCEVLSNDPTAVLDHVASVIVAWKKAHVLCLGRKGGTVRACILDMADVAAVLGEAIESEDVVSFVDMTRLGGCAVDFSPMPGNAVDVLLTAWGNREPTAERLAALLNTDVFRGN